jgi:hypothetical protein
MIPRGPLVILLLLPLVNGEPQYRVRSTADGLDRGVLENRIRLEQEAPAVIAMPAQNKQDKRRR